MRFPRSWRGRRAGGPRFAADRGETAEQLQRFRQSDARSQKRGGTRSLPLGAGRAAPVLGFRCRFRLPPGHSPRAVSFKESEPTPRRGRERPGGGRQMSRVLDNASLPSLERESPDGRCGLGFTDRTLPDRNVERRSSRWRVFDLGPRRAGGNS
jgi:hypothetical protein